MLTQAAQAHHRNADVTLAWKRCCVTNGYLQRFVWGIDLVTVFDAILTSRQPREKLQCLYENLMYRSNRSFNMPPPGIPRAFDTFAVPGRGGI